MWDVRPWEDVVEHFRSLNEGEAEDDYRRAVRGIEQVARFVADGPLSRVLFGWTSVFDLCIQQTDTINLNSPYLRLAADRSGKIEFRYIDTAIERRQWCRTVAPDQATKRLVSFLDQLHWLAGPVSQYTMPHGPTPRRLIVSIKEC